MPFRVLPPLLADDVLLVRVLGNFDRDAMRLAVDRAATQRNKGRDFGALLLDLTLAATVDGITPQLLADLWLERLPRTPCAVLRGGCAEAFCRELALLLAMSPDQATAMTAFGTADRQAAMQWARESAVIFRLWQARR